MNFPDFYLKWQAGPLGQVHAFPVRQPKPESSGNVVLLCFRFSLWVK